MGISTERTTQIHQTKRWNRRRARSYLATNAQKGAYNASELNWVEHQGELGTQQRQSYKFKFWGNLNQYLRYGGGGHRHGQTRSSPVIFGGGPFRAFARTAQDYEGSGNLPNVYIYDYDDNLWGWGNNSYGQMGHGDIVVRSSPVLLHEWNKLGPFKQFKNAYYGTVGLTTASDLYVCGYNYNGRFGFGDTEVFTNWDIDGNYIDGYNTVGVTTLGSHTINVSKPVRIAGKWKDANINQYQTGRINEDGELFFAGQNRYGMFGNGSSEAFGRSTPVTIPGKFRRIVECAYYNNFFETEDGQTLVAGYETNGWLGVPGPTASRSSPVVFPGTWARIQQSIGCYIMTDYSGNVWGVGSNSYGILGQGDIAPRSRPTLVWSGHPDGSGKIKEFNIAGSAYGHYFLMDDDTLWGVGMNYSTGLIWTSGGQSAAAAGWYNHSYWSCMSGFQWQSLSTMRSFPCFVQGGWDAKTEDEVINNAEDPWKYSRLTRAGSAGLLGFHVPGTDEGTVWSQFHGNGQGESDVPKWNMMNRENYTWHDDDVAHQNDMGQTP